MWLRRMASRRSPSMRAVTSSPSAIVPASDHRRGARTQPGQAVLGVVDTHPGAARRSSITAGVAHLAAGLGVEGRAVEHHARPPRRRRPAPGAHGLPPARAPRLRRVVLLTAGEVGGAALVEQLAVELERGGLRPARRPPCGPPWRACAARPCGVGRRRRRAATALRRDLTREVDREPEGVVQEERVVTGHVAAGRARRRAGRGPAPGSGGSAPPRGSRRRARGRRCFTSSG